MNVVPCVSWVKRGVAAANPDKVQLTPQELEKIIKQTQSTIKDLESDVDSDQEEETLMERDKAKHKKKAKNDEQMRTDEYEFDKYDDENDDVHCNIGSLAVFNEDGSDPFITVKESEDEDSEKEDDIIKPDDNLVLIGHVEGDASILEIFVYNEKEGSFYCHHDIFLPSFPLCVEWLNFDPSDSKPGNLCAVGNMTPIIDVWDLDLIDCLEPAYKLGQKPSKRKNQKRIGHRDAVLDIAWNCNYTHVLASGSVDQTVLLWDLENGMPVTKLSSFNEKIQAIKWHTTQAQQLLTGCSDKVARLFDCRTDDNFKSWQTQGEVERVQWNHFDPNYYLVGTDNGYMQYIDTRVEESIWQIQAHEKEVTGLSFSTSCPGLLVTSSNDGVVKVWDVLNCKEPQLVWEKRTNLGALQCLAANPDAPFVFAVGGDNKSHNFKLFDLLEVTEVSNRFKSRDLVKIESVSQEISIVEEEVGSREEMMEVTEDMESMALGTANCGNTDMKKKKKKNRK